ncbi:MAG: D-alanyl-D-alanine carboxypeptidase [Bacteroidota bacterium]
MRALFTKTFFIFHFSLFVIFSSCSVSKKISQQADKILLHDPVINTGTIGISIYEPSTKKYWYNYNATKNFIPGSNTKLFTLYAGMKYLGDSLVGLRYNGIQVRGTGDPTFLHPDFIKQPVFDFLKTQKKMLLDPYIYNGYGTGWAWDDYMEAFMPSITGFPIYGNLITVKWISKDSITVVPKYFEKTTKKINSWPNGFNLRRSIFENGLLIEEGNNKNQKIPFSTYYNHIKDLLVDTLPNLSILHLSSRLNNTDYNIIHSQPCDSLFKPMMHNSDNFFAEQTLLMVSNEKLGYMDDEVIIDTFLNNDLKDIPQKPRWVDGSGLSRYNLFTPQSFVYILNKLKNEFGLERLKEILPTGGEGTLKNYYLADSLSIYAKTGSMSNQNALSGFIITKQNNLLIFSVLANNFQGKAGDVRRKVEQFLEGIRNRY